MPWIESPPEPCKHPNRPAARYGEQRQWECGTCGERFRVRSVDYGHDVMPGESPVGADWVRA